MGNEEEKILASRLPEKEPGLAKDKTLWSYTEARIAEIIAKFGDKDMWIDGATDEKISFQSFLTMVKKTAAVLKEKYGVGPGSVMLVCSKNDINFFIPVYAAVALGAVAFTVPDYSSNCIPTHLAEENVPVIVCDHSSLLEIEKYVDEAFEKSSDEDRVRSQIILMSGTHAGYLDVRNIATGNADKNIEFPEIDQDEVCLTFLSSGSTGPPKAIAHTHRSLLSFTYNNDGNFTGEDEEDVRLCTVNHGHIGGFFAFMSVISSASAGISFSQYKPDMLLGAIQRYKVTTVWLYPKDAMYLTKLPEETWKEFDLSRVCRMSAGAAIFPASIVAVMRNIFPNLNRPISQTYGSTEMMLTVSSSTLMCSEQEAGLGVLAPRTKCKVVSIVDGKSLGPYDCGEFWIHTPFLMKNYRNRPDLTSAAVTPDGWYKTGDYGYYDDQERFHIKDRVKDLILLPDGKTLVSPSTIENLVLQHEAVFQVGVSGIPSTSGTGNVPRAFVILKQHVQDLVPDDIVKFVEGKTSDKNLLLTGGAEFIKSMVMSPGGKIYRMKLREDFIQQQKLRA